MHAPLLCRHSKLGERSRAKGAEGFANRSVHGSFLCPTQIRQWAASRNRRGQWAGELRQPTWHQRRQMPLGTVRQESLEGGRRCLLGGLLRSLRPAPRLPWWLRGVLCQPGEEETRRLLLGSLARAWAHAGLLLFLPHLLHKLRQLLLGGSILGLLHEGQRLLHGLLEPVFYGLFPLPEDLIQLLLGQVVTEDAVGDAQVFCHQRRRCGGGRGACVHGHCT
mmetsp:Transcript_16466/g.23076  ORF Transcript_16466/g.23076 Transcript_16466/m.23076 type:complete len:221 (-) Transcript_16466:655-1317(-)